MQNFLLIPLQNKSKWTEKLRQVDFERQVDLILHILTEKNPPKIGHTTLTSMNTTQGGQSLK